MCGRTTIDALTQESCAYLIKPGIWHCNNHDPFSETEVDHKISDLVSFATSALSTHSFSKDSPILVRDFFLPFEGRRMNQD